MHLDTKHIILYYPSRVIAISRDNKPIISCVCPLYTRSDTVFYSMAATGVLRGELLKLSTRLSGAIAIKRWQRRTAD